MSVFDDPACYPAIALHQPYAGAIRLSGLGYPAKRIETRKTRIHYRGPLVICATAKSPEGATGRGGALVGGLLDPSRAWWALGAFQLEGVAVAIAEVVGCRPLVAEDFPRSLWWDPEENARKPRWAWELEDIVPLKPFAVKSSQGYGKVTRARTDAAARAGLQALFENPPGIDAFEIAALSWPLPVEQEGGRW